VHGYRVAEILHLPALIAPLGAGVGSTLGLLVAPLAFDFVRSAYGLLDEMDWDLANALLDEMAAEGRDVLERSGLAAADITSQRTADMRYSGQGHEVSVPLPDGALSEVSRPAIVAAFDRVYRGLYGRAGPDVPLEVINWRLVATGPRPALDLRLTNAAVGAAATARKGSRDAWFPEHGGYVETPVYDRYALAPGAKLDGPAIVEERESTLIIGPKGRARVDEQLNLVIEINAG
jgi:N-methylhydantoinase A